MTLCQEIADQIAALPEKLPDSVEHAATRALIDWVAAVVAGGEHPATEALRRATLNLSGGGDASVIGTAVCTDARSAALINGTAAHATEVDDIYRDGLYHPGAPTVAAAVAIAQSAGSDGQALLRSIVIGYEVGCRIATAINPAHYRFWHTTGTVGTLGAATAAAAALRLDTAKTANALAIATTMSAGLQQSFRSDSMAKPLHAGHAADAGVLGALAAAHGLTGALDVLEGPAGFGAAMSGQVDWGPVVAAWNEPWAVTNLTVKNHTACGHTFAPIDAILSLRSQYDFKPDEVEHILVETARTPIEVAGNIRPMTAFEAKFSIPYCAAAALTIGSVRLNAFTDDALADPALRNLVDRTEMRVAEEFDLTFPRQRAARVVIHLKNGETLTEEAWTRRGDPDAPLSNEELSDKFIELVAPSHGSSASRILDSLWSIGNAHSVADLFVPAAA